MFRRSRESHSISIPEAKYNNHYLLNYFLLISPFRPYSRAPDSALSPLPRTYKAEVKHWKLSANKARLTRNYLVPPRSSSRSPAVSRWTSRRTSPPPPGPSRRSRSARCRGRWSRCVSPAASAPRPRSRWPGGGRGSGSTELTGPS